jgi:hypothetical protein
MKTKRYSDYTFFSDENGGEYHISNKEVDRIGIDAAIEKAKEAILKKRSLDRYQGKSINFEQAESLGFCDYGIRDFCQKLDLDIDESYMLSDILEKLTVKAFLDYPDEVRKLFGKDAIMNKFGGVKNFLANNRTKEALNFVLTNKFIDEKRLHILACDFAENVLHIFEKEYPDDNRPRRAIEVKRLWIEEEEWGVAK